VKPDDMKTSLFESMSYIHMFTGVGCETKMIFMFTIASETKAFVKKAGI